MSGNVSQHLADELTSLLENYTNLQKEITKAQDRLAGREPESYDLYAVGGILHDVYRGAETICHFIAKEFDQELPTGKNWHRLILDQMTKAFTTARPTVLQLETTRKLEEYRKFRHVFRNIYGPELDWPQMKPLLDNAGSTIDAFRQDVQEFIAFLRMISD